MNLMAVAKVLGATPLSEKKLTEMRRRDDRVINELYEKCAQSGRYYSEATGLYFFNGALASYARAQYDQPSMAQLGDFLSAKGVIGIPIADGFEVTVGGDRRSVAIVAATDISVKKYHGEMSSMVYLRDHIQTAAALMELYLTNPTRYNHEGETARKLLLSALDLLSTPAQLQRFKEVTIQKGRASQEAWPHISLWFDDLQGDRPNGWRNIQDSFQMLGYHVLDALERDFLTIAELSVSHRAFLGSIVPLLDAVGFPRYENSGSWEEVAARRTSVIAIETALLYKYYTLVDYDFLPDKTLVERLLRQGLHELASRLPYESSDYPEDDIRYRQADAALVYVLLYHLPELFEKFTIPVGERGVLSVEEIEVMVLDQLAVLDDAATGGMRRYAGDSYQRLNFHTEEVQWVVRAIKQKVQADAQMTRGPVDYAMKQRFRGELTPSEYEAAWTHPLGQLAAWAARQSLRKDAPTRYRAHAERFLNRTLALVTGEMQWHIVREEDEYAVLPAPAFALPECYIAYRHKEKDAVFVPSPHTPLNWSSAMLRLAVGLLRERS